MPASPLTSVWPVYHNDNGHHQTTQQSKKYPVRTLRGETSFRRYSWVDHPKSVFFAALGHHHFVYLTLYQVVDSLPNGHFIRLDRLFIQISKIRFGIVDGFGAQVFVRS